MTSVDLSGDGRKEILMSYDIYSYEEQIIEGTVNTVIQCKEARMVIFSRDAMGDFKKSCEYDFGLSRQTVATADFNGDGKPDIVIGGYEVENAFVFPPSHTSIVEVLLQEQNGTFYDVFSSVIHEFLGPVSIVTGDFDGDGKIDFVVGGFATENESPYHACVFHNEGGSSFAMSQLALRKGIVVADMWKADIDGDGSADLVTQAIDLDSATPSIILLLNDGRGQFESRELDVPADSMIIEDLTGDGYPDILYTESEESGDKVYFLRNDQGELSEPQLVNVPSEGRITAMICADLSNDTNALGALFLESRVEFKEEGVEITAIEHLVLIQKDPSGELSFAPKWSHEFLEGEDISSRHAVAAADINDDGRTDFILVSGPGEVYLALNQHT